MTNHHYHQNGAFLSLIVCVTLMALACASATAGSSGDSVEESREGLLAEAGERFANYWISGSYEEALDMVDDVDGRTSDCDSDPIRIRACTLSDMIQENARLCRVSSEGCTRALYSITTKSADCTYPSTAMAALGFGIGCLVKVDVVGKDQYALCVMTRFSGTRASAVVTRAWTAAGC